jgi:hypothetical protein
VETSYGEFNFKLANGENTGQEFSYKGDDEAEIGTLFADDGSIHL